MTKKIYRVLCWMMAHKALRGMAAKGVKVMVKFDLFKAKVMDKRRSRSDFYFDLDRQFA